MLLSIGRFSMGSVSLLLVSEASGRRQSTADPVSANKIKRLQNLEKQIDLPSLGDVDGAGWYGMDERMGRARLSTGDDPPLSLAWLPMEGGVCVDRLLA
jgi:hypothetical protein